MILRLIFVLVVLNLLDPQRVAGQTYFENVQKYRDDTNAEFGDSLKSILPPEERAHFVGLDYFPIDQAYRVKAKFKPIKNGKVVVMKTSGTRTPSYKPYGVLSFKLGKAKCKLTLYQMADPARPQYANHLLLAFTDKTNGFTTYGGGRYIEYTTADITSEMFIDFNYCFNPYCAYTDGYNCVIPPAENALKIEINAGVKKYHD